MSSAVKVALVGISGYGDSYLESLLHDPRAHDLSIVGLIDPAPQRCRRLAEIQSRRIQVFPSLAGFLTDHTVDLVMIATPIHLHAPQTCLSLQRGASVLCEKPLAGSLADALKMLDAQETADGFAAIGYQWSFSSAVQSLKQDIMDGVLGKPIRMKASVSFPRPLSYFKRNDWAGRLRTPDGKDVMDSPVNNATAHYLHNMLYILGETRETSATVATVQAELYRANDIENYDTAALRVTTQRGAEVLFYTTHAVADRAGPHSVFEFENAVVVYDDAGAGQFIARFHDGRIKPYGNPNLDRHEKIWQSVDALRGGNPVACCVRAALPHTLCVLAAQHSMPKIGEFPSSLIRRVDCGDETMIVVRELAEAMSDCYDKAILPSEAGRYDWARGGAVIDVVDPTLERESDSTVALPA